MDLTDLNLYRLSQQPASGTEITMDLCLGLAASLQNLWQQWEKPKALGAGVEQTCWMCWTEPPDSSGRGSAPPQAQGVLQGAGVSSSGPVLPNSCLLCWILQVINEILPKARGEILEDRQILAEVPQEDAQEAKNPWAALLRCQDMCRARQLGSLENSLCQGIITGSGWNLNEPSGNQRKETKATPEHCVNSWSSLRRVGNRGPAGDWMCKVTDRCSCHGKGILASAKRHFFVLERHLCSEKMMGECKTAWGAWKDEDVWIEQKVRNCSSPGWAGKHCWQRCRNMKSYGTLSPQSLWPSDSTQNKPSFPQVLSALTVTSSESYRGFKAGEYDVTIIKVQWREGRKWDQGCGFVKRFSKSSSKQSGRFCLSLLCCRNGKGRKKQNKRTKKLKKDLIQGELKIF